MKKLLSIILLFAFNQTATAQDFNKSMAEIMKNMKGYTLEMVERIPEDQFDFKPVDSMRTFREQVVHIIASNHFLLNHFLIHEQKSNPEDLISEARYLTQHKDKRDLLEALDEEFENLILFFEKADEGQYNKTYSFGTEENPIVKNYVTTVLLIRDHISHHRAQLIVYLRILQLVPPPYQGF